MAYDLEAEVWFEPNKIIYIELEDEEIESIDKDEPEWKCPTELPSDREMFEISSVNGDIEYIDKEEFDAKRLFDLIERGYGKIYHLDKLQHQSREVLLTLLKAYIHRKDSLKAQLDLFKQAMKKEQTI